MNVHVYVNNSPYPLTHDYESLLQLKKKEKKTNLLTRTRRAKKWGKGRLFNPYGRLGMFWPYF